ncbi:hypothetical protein [Methylovulum psychrotolerans]|uniref:Uncharacterized protein n=1 Tax=Methylovulum psychrotolerans TaxID=1704499 RepID=A0A1Z4BVM3_9GAMM|nr:hypothetical protein [Methylovulum psychrotolerans]ASF45345.1 hypothetical protein CEK71_04280 [Methylovulum psychrotolerans]
MEIEIPTETDWEEYWADLDQRDAYEVFYGRTNAEMHKEFRKYVTGRTTDLRFMPAIPFRYYMLGFKDFVVSSRFDELDAPDVANCYISLVEDKLKDAPEHILPIFDKLLGTAEYIANHQDDYGASVHIYGDFQDKLTLIKELARKAGSG